MISGLINRLTGLAEVHEVAVMLAERFSKKTSRVGSGGVQFQRAVDELVADAKGIVRHRGWGFFRSSRLANAVRWKLVEAGLSNELADAVARQLAVGVVYAGKKQR